MSLQPKFAPGERVRIKTDAEIQSMEIPDRLNPGFNCTMAPNCGAICEVVTYHGGQYHDSVSLTHGDSRDAEVWTWHEDWLEAVDANGNPRIADRGKRAGEALLAALAAAAKPREVWLANLRGDGLTYIDLLVDFTGPGKVSLQRLKQRGLPVCDDLVFGQHITSNCMYSTDQGKTWTTLPMDAEKIP